MPLNNEERIRRMVDDGLISPRQAVLLRESLESASPTAGHRPVERRRPAVGRWVAWGLVVAVLAGLSIALAAGGGPETVQDVAQNLNRSEGYGEMNRTISALLAVGLFVVVPILAFVFLYNSLVAKEEKVSESWAQAESNFQRRADLIPSLVETVSRYLKHERETLTDVTDKRAAAAERLADAVDALLEAHKASSDIQRANGEAPIEDEAQLRHLYEAETAVGRRIGNIFAVVEAYPDLKSSDQFLQLQAQLEGTENRLNVARMRFNEAVGDYNSALRMTPYNIIAMLGNFHRKAYFSSSEDAHNVPSLAFD